LAAIMNQRIPGFQEPRRAAETEQGQTVLADVARANTQTPTSMPIQQVQRPARRSETHGAGTQEGGDQRTDEPHRWSDLSLWIRGDRTDGAPTVQALGALVAPSWLPGSMGF